MSKFQYILVYFAVVVISYSNCQNEAPFLWNTLVNVSSRHFNTLFLPNYLKFNADITTISLDNFELLSTNCSLDLLSTLNALTNRQIWALELFNSWAKFPPTGTLRGTLTDFGDYDQCLSVSHLSTQYCLLDFSLPMPRPMPRSHNFYHYSKVLPATSDEQAFSGLSNETITFLANGSMYRKLEQFSSLFYYTFVQIGICLPQRCTRLDVESIIETHLIKYGFNLEKFTCNAVQTEWSFNSAQIVAVLFICAITFLTLLAAIYDHCYAQNAKVPHSFKCLLWFSPLRNARKLLCTQSSDDDLACVHGLRIVTLLLIIIGHSLDWNSLNMFRDTFTIKDRVSQLILQPLYRGQMTVDTFFYLSGLLTSWITLKYTKGDYNNFNYTKFLLLRYLRLTPQLVAFLLMTILLPALFDGPVWHRYVDKLDYCYSNWWLNLVYLQNIINIEKICALHTWFLAADMQLHWISLLPVVALLMNRQNGIRLAQFMIALSVLWSSLTIYTQKLPPGAIITSKNDFLDEKGMPSEYLRFCYKPLTHAHVFFIGFLFGDYLQRNYKQLKQLRLKTSHKYLLWLCAFTGYIFTIYSMLPWLYGRPYNPFISAILFPLNLLVWSFVLTLVIWLCITPNGGIIGHFLSSSAFRPLSRMTYSIYLTHVWVLLVALGARRELIDLNLHAVVLLLAAIVIFSFAVGFTFTVLVENPVIHAIDWLKVYWTEKENSRQFLNSFSDEVKKKEQEYKEVCN